VVEIKKAGAAISQDNFVGIEGEGLPGGRDTEAKAEEKAKATPKLTPTSLSGRGFQRPVKMRGKVLKKRRKGQRGRQEVPMKSILPPKVEGRKRGVFLSVCLAFRTEIKKNRRGGGKCRRRVRGERGAEPGMRVPGGGPFFEAHLLLCQLVGSGMRGWGVYYAGPPCCGGLKNS